MYSIFRTYSVIYYFCYYFLYTGKVEIEKFLSKEFLSSAVDWKVVKIKVMNEQRLNKERKKQRLNEYVSN